MKAYPKVELASGKNKLKVRDDGSIDVTGVNLEVGSVTATNVSVRDGSDADRKLKVNGDGSVNISIIEDTIAEIADIASGAVDEIIDVVTGEAEEEPADHTILGRLKSLEEKLETVATWAETANVCVVGSKYEEYKTDKDADNDIITFADNVVAIEIFHDEAEPQEFTVNGIDILVPPGGWKSVIGGDPSDEVGIPADVECVIIRFS